MAWIKLTDSDGGPVLVNFDNVNTVVPVDPAYPPHGSVLLMAGDHVAVCDSISDIATALVATSQQLASGPQTRDPEPDGPATGPRLHRG